jgi:ADP-ribose pyrophosphatase YjhB (NUDIX family)
VLTAEEYEARLPRKRIAAGVLIRDRANPSRMLLVEPTYKPEWEIPGGIVEDGESPWAGASRELREELGLTIQLGRILVVDYVSAHGLRHDGIMFVFDGGLLDEADLACLVFADGEIRSAGFYTKPEAWDKLPAHVAGRVDAAMHAAEHDTTAWCEMGRRLS